MLTGGRGASLLKIFPAGNDREFPDAGNAPTPVVGVSPKPLNPLPQEDTIGPANVVATHRYHPPPLHQPKPAGWRLPPPPGEFWTKRRRRRQCLRHRSSRLLNGRPNVSQSQNAGPNAGGRQNKAERFVGHGLKARALVVRAWGEGEGARRRGYIP